MVQDFAGLRTGTSAVSFISPPRRTTSAAGSSPMSSASALRPGHNITS